MDVSEVVVRKTSRFLHNVPISSLFFFWNSSALKEPIISTMRATIHITSPARKGGAKKVLSFEALTPLIQSLTWLFGTRQKIDNPDIKIEQLLFAAVYRTDVWERYFHNNVRTMGCDAPTIGRQIIHGKPATRRRSQWLCSTTTHRGLSKSSSELAGSPALWIYVKLITK